MNGSCTCNYVNLKQMNIEKADVDWSKEVKMYEKTGILEQFFTMPLVCRVTSTLIAKLTFEF